MPFLTQGIAAIGTLIARGDGATPTENFTVIAEVKDITGPAGKVTMLPITHHQSDSGYEELYPGLKAGDVCALKMNFLPEVAGQYILRQDFENKKRSNYKITFPFADAPYCIFPAFVSKPPSPKAPVTGVLEGDADLTTVGALHFYKSDGTLIV